VSARIEVDQKYQASVSQHWETEGRETISCPKLYLVDLVAELLTEN
jgi:hypothetical protein